ncbi:zf-HC2 domain-containing protein [Paraburkholderia sp. MMS20-SJTN17]|uniref:Zf-HC2 domain-containing protein n=1 Tax=Paraburkholderia translucens TaxID=2886945 RepID=A0ABS8KCH1_9BURK|nr:zf-HC2 domain-containing protein [Paraburkholderia sp. MMS20-SJTN17]MCC8402466.1 zf-HC2 domain-containing protein [Paraburkholderia sp. MMS20-SJTN17]
MTFLLIAYVDGELTPRERAEVNNALDTSPGIAARVALFAASSLPYQDELRRNRPRPRGRTRVFSRDRRTALRRTFRRNGGQLD